MPLISEGTMEKKSSFRIRYVFQAVVHAIWKEWNKIKHGEQHLPMPILKKLIDKGIRNKLSLMRMKMGKCMEGALQFWFETRVNNFFLSLK